MRVVLFAVVFVVSLSLLLIGENLGAANRQPRDAQSQNQPRFVVHGPQDISGGSVYVLQDGHTDTCYLIVTLLGQSFTPPPQPCAE